jgi:hypothetical protein
MNNETTESIVKRLMELEGEKRSLLNNLEKEAIRQLQETTDMVKSRPPDYEFSHELRTAARDLVSVLETTSDNATQISGEGTKTRQRINRGEKDQLFEEIVSEFKAENSADQMPFSEIARRLEENGHKPASVSVFFRNQLKEKHTEGNTRSKVLLLNHEEGGAT